MKNAEKPGEAEAQRLQGRAGPEDAEEVASYEQVTSVHVPALEHMCGTSVLLVHASLVRWFSECGPLGVECSAQAG